MTSFSSKIQTFIQLSYCPKIIHRLQNHLALIVAMQLDPTLCENWIYSGFLVPCLKHLINFFIVTHILLKIFSGLQFSNFFFEILPHWGCIGPLKVQLKALELQHQILTLMPALTNTFLFKMPANCNCCIQLD